MAFRSSKKLPTKAERASVIGLGLASLLLQGGERVRLLNRPVATISGRLALIQMAHHLEREIATSPTTEIPMSPVSLPRHSAVVLISDFMAPIEALEKTITSYAGQAVRGHLLQILDPAEEVLPYSGRIQFQGMEEEGQLLIERTEDVRADYQRKLAEQRAQIASITSRLGWTFNVHHTDKQPHTALIHLHNRLAEQSW